MARASCNPTPILALALALTSTLAAAQTMNHGAMTRHRLPRIPGARRIHDERCLDAFVGRFSRAYALSSSMASSRHAYSPRSWLNLPARQRSPCSTAKMSEIEGIRQKRTQLATTDRVLDARQAIRWSLILWQQAAVSVGGRILRVPA
jgi:hypothetical protein